MNKKVYRIPFKQYITRAYCFGDIFNKTPLIILHGGPGGCVERYEPLEKLADFGIPLIFYDQLGCGYSKVPKNAKINWNFSIFLEELENLIEFFNLKKFNILGHSWGGMLALEYICNSSHLGLEKLILFSTLSSTKIWNDEHLKMIESFPADIKQELINSYNGKSFDKKKFNEGVKLFCQKHVGKKSKELYQFKRKKFPKTNKEIYGSMWGDNELFGTGSLKDWSVEESLNKVNVPTLILSGALDESTPKMNELMNKKISNSIWIMLKNSHHIGYVEENNLVIKRIITFLQK